jgi:chaperonin GroEL
MGFNLRSAKIENLIESGIFDALNVVTSTLIDAVSISSMILTTECVIANSKTYTRSFIFFANI